MREAELSSIVSARIADALGETSGELSQLRQESYDYYMGEPYGNEEDGQSQVVTREALEVVEWALPSLMRIFASGSQIAVFDPVDEDDEAGAKQETDIVNHVLTKQNNIFIVLHNWFKDTLINPNGYIKIWADEQVTVTKETYHGLTVEDLGINEQDDELEAVSQEEVVTYDANEVKTTRYDVEYKRTRTLPAIRIQNVPPEEMLLDGDHDTISLDDVEFVCHRVEKTFTELAQIGYDQDVLRRINDEEEGEYNDERLNRRVLEDELPDGSEADDPALRKYWVHECYLLVDYDEDGIAERRKVVQIGKEIMENEEMDYIPFEALGTMPLPHKHLALSLVDVTKDIQIVNSTLWRQGLDNLYRVNYPRTIAGQGVNIDDLLSFRPNQIVRAKDVNQLTIEPTQPVMGQLLPMIEWVNQNKEARTGVSRYTKGLDAETLAQSTKGAFLGAQEQANQRLEMIARIFAETGVKGMVRKVHRLIRQYGYKDRVLKIKNKYIPVKPDEWKDRENVTVMVGLGHGTREQAAVSALKVLEIQEKMLPVGMATPENLYHSLAKLIEAIGWKDAELYFTNPENRQPQPERPDPQMEALKATIQLEATKIQQKHEQFEAEMQRKYTDMEQKHEEKLTEMELKFVSDIPGSLV